MNVLCCLKVNLFKMPLGLMTAEDFQEAENVPAIDCSGEKMLMHPVGMFYQVDPP